jgi:hypothetical protein
VTTSNLYSREAETFVVMMRELAPGLVLDFSTDSIPLLEDWIHEGFDPPGTTHVGDMLVAGVGCYLGEVIVRTIGGSWSPAGEINHIGVVDATFPLAKATKRFRSGERHSLVAYYELVAETVGLVPAI